MATDFIKPKSGDNCRFADASCNYLAACGVGYTGAIDTEFIVNINAECSTHNGATETLELEWENTTDNPGVWNKLQAAAGEIRQGTNTDLVDGTSPFSNIAAAGCDTPLADSEEVEGDSNFVAACPNRAEIAEEAIAIDPSNADPGDVYSFRVYSVTGAAVVGDGTAWGGTYTARQEL